MSLFHYVNQFHLTEQKLRGMKRSQYHSHNLLCVWTQKIVENCGVNGMLLCFFKF